MKQPKVLLRPVNNYTKGRAGNKPIAIVIHRMLGSMAGTRAWFNNPKSKVSAHFGVSRKGVIHHYVGEENTAWANGTISNPTWQRLLPNKNPNLYTLAVELEGYYNEHVCGPQLSATAWLIAGLSKRWAIPLNRLHTIAHNEIYSKKDCPGSGVALHMILHHAKKIK